MRTFFFNVTKGERSFKDPFSGFRPDLDDEVLVLPKTLLQVVDAGLKTFHASQAFEPEFLEMVRKKGEVHRPPSA